ALLENMVLESGFIREDCGSMIDGSIEFLRDFARYASEQPAPESTVRHSYAGGNERVMRIMRRPFHCVAALVPQNASMCVAITIIASALHAGSRVVVRPSLQCAATGLMLADLMERSRPPGDCVRIVHCLASN